jgi:RNA polymerase sigma-70 factor (ECF subfamily)
MPPPVPEQISRTIESLYRSESGRVLATLVRLLGDLDLAEEAMHEAFATALESWPQTGIPEKPRPWLISMARFKAIDGLRRRTRFDEAQRDIAAYVEHLNKAPLDEEEIEDDRLRLIFTCCHPALSPEGQIALTLREVCGLSTDEIAHAFLVTPAALAQRIVRAKTLIRDKTIPYEVPVSAELPARLGTVLLVVYLIFNEGYSAETTGAELSREAIRLGRLLLDLLPDPEVMGFVGLMLLQESRRTARSSPDGDLILLEQQDRSLWNREQIAEGISLTENALQSRRFGAYTLRRPLRLFTPRAPPRHPRIGGRFRCFTTACFRFTLAGCRAEPRSGHCHVQRSGAGSSPDRRPTGTQGARQLLPRALCPGGFVSQIGRIPEARASYQKALALLAPGKDRQEPERRFLTRRLQELE